MKKIYIVQTFENSEIVRGRFSPWKEQIRYEDLPARMKRAHDWAVGDEMFVIFRGEAIPMENFQSSSFDGKSKRAVLTGVAPDSYFVGHVIEMDRDCMVRVAPYFVRSK